MVSACAFDKLSVMAILWFDCFGAGDALLCQSLFISTAKIGFNSETDKEMHPNYCLFPCNFISPPCNLPFGSSKTGSLNMTGWMILICEQHFYSTRLQKLTPSPIWDEGCFVTLVDGSWFSCEFLISWWWNFPMLSMATKDEGSGMAPPQSSSVTFPPFCHQSEGDLGC